MNTSSRKGLFWAAWFALIAPLCAWQSVGLENGLRYVQTRSLTQDQPAFEESLATDVPHIVDVRGTPATLVEAEALLSALRGPQPAGPGALRVVLINSGTSEILRERLAPHTPGVVVLSPEAAKLASSVAVRTDLDNDLEAAESLAAGDNPTAWLAVPPVKTRNDEAALAKLHAAKFGIERERLSESEDAEAAPKPSPTPVAKARRVDDLLQRAVQLHEAYRLRAAARK